MNNAWSEMVILTLATLFITFSILVYTMDMGYFDYHFHMI